MVCRQRDIVGSAMNPVHTPAGLRRNFLRGCANRGPRGAKIHEFMESFILVGYDHLGKSLNIGILAFVPGHHTNADFGSTHFHGSVEKLTATMGISVHYEKTYKD